MQLYVQEVVGLPNKIKLSFYGQEQELREMGLNTHSYMSQSTTKKSGRKTKYFQPSHNSNEMRRKEKFTLADEQVPFYVASGFSQGWNFRFVEL